MEIQLLPYQKQFLQSKTKYVWLKSALGSGKSYALSWYIIGRMLTNPETMGLITANSYTQLHNSIMVEVFRNLDLLGLTYSFNMLTKELVLHATGARALCLSLEKYESLRGIQVGYIAADELAFSREAAYSVMIGRLRCPKSHALEGRFASTPNGFNWIHRIFAEGKYISRTETPTVHTSKYHEMISATAYDNFFLPKDYIPSLENQYSPLMVQQELLGEFVNTEEGKVYHTFDRSILKVSKEPIIDIRAGADFNVTPITAAYGSVVGNQSVHIFDETWIENSNTFELSEAINEVQSGMIVYPDASGAARHTSASKSDHQILRDAGFDVKTKRKNPSIRDRYNNVNRWISNGWLTIDPKCVRLINDLQQLTHENKDPKLSHISDALGYMLWHINALKRKQLPSGVRNL